MSTRRIAVTGVSCGSCGEQISEATIDQRVDRRVDPPWDTKKVVKADGTVVHDISHPLSEHRDRGSAKPKKP